MGSAGRPAAAVPGDVKGLVARRARALPPPTREVLLAAAALPPTHGCRCWPRRWAEPPGADLEPAERAGMVELDGGVVRFTHPLFATAIYASASVEGRRRVHRRLAAAVDDAEHQARHLALAAEGPDERVAAGAGAGGGAVGRRVVALAAAELAGKPPADAGAGDGRGADTRAMLAAECHLVAGDLGRAHALLEEVVAATPARAPLARPLVLLGQVRYHQDSFPDAAGLFAQAREQAPATRGCSSCRGAAGLRAGQRGGRTGRGRPRHPCAGAAGGVRSATVLAGALALSAMVDVLCGGDSREDAEHGPWRWRTPTASWSAASADLLFGVFLLWWVDPSEALGVPALDWRFVRPAGARRGSELPGDGISPLLGSGST